MGYLTTQEYLDLYGEVETIRITDETKSGNVDLTKLGDAIDAASALSDSYLGARYPVPLSVPYPEIVKSIVAPLARELLNRNRPPQAVTDQANLARSQLKDLSAGRAVITVAAGATPIEENATAVAATAGDARRRVFTDCALDDFTSFQGGFGGTVFGSGNGGGYLP